MNTINLTSLIFIFLLPLACILQTSYTNTGRWENFKNNLCVKSIAEILTATAINEAFALTILGAMPNYNGQALRQAFAILCAPPIARRLQLMPLLLQRLSNRPLLRKTLSHLIKHGICLTVTFSFGVLVYSYEPTAPVGDISIQYFIASLLMLLQDLAATSGRINDQTLLNQLVQIDESLLQQLASFQENRTRESITATQSPSIANDRV